jgi:hypothetical protein
MSALLDAIREARAPTNGKRPALPAEELNKRLYVQPLTSAELGLTRQARFRGREIASATPTEQKFDEIWERLEAEGRRPSMRAVIREANPPSFHEEIRLLTREALRRVEKLDEKWPLEWSRQPLIEALQIIIDRFRATEAAHRTPGDDEARGAA